LLVTSISFLSSLIPLNFKQEQLKYLRVKTAYKNHWVTLKKEIHLLKIDTSNFTVYLRAFKKEGELEVWIKNKPEKKFKLLKTFNICSSSGILGPKKMQGDGQVPEGFYKITAFNPYSSYHLSLKVGYPNKADAKNSKGPLGGDIMIHGKCVTIGCIPIEDMPIEQLYVLCVESQNNKQTINIDVFPFKFTDKTKLTEAFKLYDESLVSFWKNLFACGEYFEKEKELTTIKINDKGKYYIN
jgi:murein L,D-transpeptidase YafK